MFDMTLAKYSNIMIKIPISTPTNIPIQIDMKISIFKYILSIYKRLIYLIKKCNLLYN